jgi:DNA-binding NarL/FixJ family response regulator
MSRLLDVYPDPTSSWAEVSVRLGPLPPSLQALSPAERAVAVYLAQGLSNREIAAALGKSEATVKHQVSACLAKSGVPTRGRLIAMLR